MRCADFNLKHKTARCAQSACSVWFGAIICCAYIFYTTHTKKTGGLLSVHGAAAAAADSVGQIVAQPYVAFAAASWQRARASPDLVTD